MACGSLRQCVRCLRLLMSICGSSAKHTSPGSDKPEQPAAPAPCARLQHSVHDDDGAMVGAIIIVPCLDTLAPVPGAQLPTCSSPSTPPPGCDSSCAVNTSSRYLSSSDKGGSSQPAYIELSRAVRRQSAPGEPMWGMRGLEKLLQMSVVIDGALSSKCSSMEL